MNEIGADGPDDAAGSAAGPIAEPLNKLSAWRQRGWMSADHGWPGAGPLDCDLGAVLRYFPLGGDLRLRR